MAHFSTAVCGLVCRKHLIGRTLLLSWIVQVLGFRLRPVLAGSCFWRWFVHNQGAFLIRLPTHVCGLMVLPDALLFHLYFFCSSVYFFVRTEAYIHIVHITCPFVGSNVLLLESKEVCQRECHGWDEGQKRKISTESTKIVMTNEGKQLCN